MNILTDVGLPLVLAFIMFSLGLGLVLDDFRRVLSRPMGFALGAMGQLVVLPLIAFLIIHAFGFSGVMAVGIMLLALCPGGVTSNLMTRLAGGDVALSVSLTAVISLVVVVTIPLILGFSLNYFEVQAASSYSVLGTSLSMFAMVALPVGIGMAVRGFQADLALRMQPIASAAATALFVILVLLAILTNWSLLMDNIFRLGPALILLNIIMLGLGAGLAVLGNQSEAATTAITLETGVQNATLGIAVAGLILPNGDSISPLALACGVYGITMYAVALPYIMWRRAS